MKFGKVVMPDDLPSGQRKHVGASGMLVLARRHECGVRSWGQGPASRWPAWAGQLGIGMALWGWLPAPKSDPARLSSEHPTPSPPDIVALSCLLTSGERGSPVSVPLYHERLVCIHVYTPHMHVLYTE